MRSSLKAIAAILVISCFAGYTSINAQSLHPDSIMQTLEQLGNELLYRNQDTSYIQNYSDKFILKLIGVTKYNYFEAGDRKLNSRVRFRPDRRINLGLGFSYKWFAIDLAFNVGIGEKSGLREKDFLDFQGSIFSSKQFIIASYQYYYGYQMNKIKGIEIEDFPATSIRQDIRTISFGLQYFFALNYDQFSLKSSFIHNEIQKKSAGSFLLGAGFGVYSLSSDSSIIALELEDYFNQKLHLTDFSSTNLSINFGYMYTFIFADYFYLTASLVPGLGVNKGDYSTDFRKPYNTHLYLGLLTMNSVGYNSERIFGGFKFTSDLFRTNIANQLHLLTGHGKLKVFLGYRFGK